MEHQNMLNMSDLLFNLIKLIKIFNSWLYFSKHPLRIQLSNQWLIFSSLWAPCARSHTKITRRKQHRIDMLYQALLFSFWFFWLYQFFFLNFVFLFFFFHFWYTFRFCLAYLCNNYHLHLNTLSIIFIPKILINRY